MPLALKHHPTMRSYVVNVVEGEPAAGAEIDSIAELGFDSLEDYLERLYDSPEGHEIIRRDVEGFLGGAAAYATSGRVHKDEAPATPLGQRSAGVKWVCALARRPGLTHEEFLSHWLGEHVPLVLEHQPVITRFVTNAVEQKLGEQVKSGTASRSSTSPAPKTPASATPTRPPRRGPRGRPRPLRRPQRRLPRSPSTSRSDATPQGSAPLRPERAAQPKTRSA